MLDWLLFFGYWIAFVTTLIGYVWTLVLFVSGGRYLKIWRSAPPGNEADYLWVFLVPALNEAVTITDSVTRLRNVNASNKIILVINDGSEDDTGAVLDSIAGPDLQVLTRVAPNSRKGKAAALNAAFALVRQQLLDQPAYAGWAPEQVICCIVDADGRLDASAPGMVARHFDDPIVGGVQCSVRIYNQTSYLTWMQALEFRVFGGLYQVGRSRWGTAFMGGNGQFNRLTALESIRNADGPWVGGACTNRSLR